MIVIEIGSQKTQAYKLVFGKDVSSEDILEQLKETASLREGVGLTTKEETLEIIKEAKEKLEVIFQ